MSTSTLDGMSFQGIGIHRQVQDRLAVGPGLDRVDLADLDAVHLDLGFGVHHEAGTFGDDGHWDGLAEAAAEHADGEEDDPREHDERSQDPPAGGQLSETSMLLPYPDRLKLPLEP